MPRSVRRFAREAGKFVVRSFIPPLAFFALFEWKGPKPAIAVTVVATLAQVIVHRVRGEKISPFFITSATFTIVFGSMDLFVHEPKYYRLAPFAENFVMGAMFGVTVAMGRPIALWFARALPEQIRPELSPKPGERGGGLEAYLKKVTYAWIAYFFAKAFFFLYLAFVVDLGKLILLRSVIGGSTIALMFAGEVLYRKKIRPRLSGGVN
jgi:uncharacterized membrane protein